MKYKIISHKSSNPVCFCVMTADLLVLLVHGPDSAQLPWWWSICRARDAALYLPGLVRCVYVNLFVWLKCLTAHCVPLNKDTVYLAALCEFAHCVWVCVHVCVCVCEWHPASLQRYRKANCILITKPSNMDARQLPSTPRNTQQMEQESVCSACCFS